MKKLTRLIFSCAAVTALTAAVGTAAMAANVTATYNAETGTLAITDTGRPAEENQQTILVLKADENGNSPTTVVADGEGKNIVQINQKDDGKFTSQVVGTLENGKYYVRIGGANGGAFAEGSFTIGDEPAPGETHKVLVGDVTGTDGVDSTDAQQILRYSVKTSLSWAGNANITAADQRIAADATGDGMYDSTDAQQTLRYAVKGTSATKVGKYAVVDNATGEVQNYVDE